MTVIKEFNCDKLHVRVFDSRAAMGECAGKEAAAYIKKLLQEKESINVMFAAAPSQNETLAELIADEQIDWSRINAFHMDEYVGLAPEAPQRFANFLKNAIFDKVPFRSVNLLDGNVAPEVECARYSALLTENPVDIVCMGIGENGHIAFNDPHVADFNDKALVKVVDLDETCRMQQVHDGCFAQLSDVPTHALTLTVPALAAAEYQFCVVPASTKAWAVRETICSEIGEHCPATIMRKLKNAVMYVDEDSAALLTEVAK